LSVSFLFKQIAQLKLEVGEWLGVELGTEVDLEVGLVLIDVLGLSLDESLGLELGWILEVGTVVVQVLQVTGHIFFASPSHTFFCQYGYAVALIFLSFSQLKPWM